MPEREYLQSAVWDVYRRWALAMFEDNQIDRAFKVFAEARRRHGVCQEELECELIGCDRIWQKTSLSKPL